MASNENKVLTKKDINIIYYFFREVIRISCLNILS